MLKTPRARFQRQTFLALICLANFSVWALDPSKPPGGNFDLSHWKLTLPTGSSGSPTEISPSQLVAGFTNANFYTGPDGAMLFWCPVDGVTTGGSSYPRSELREEIDGLTDDDAYWTIQQFAVSELQATCAVQQVGPSKGRVIIGQIHAPGFPFIKLVYEYKTSSQTGSVVAQINQNSTSSDTEKDYTVATNIPLDTKLNYVIETQNSGSAASLIVTVNSDISMQAQVDESNWISGSNNGLYFKAGDYVQETGTSSLDGGQVSFYALTVSHFTNAPITPVWFTNYGINTNKYFSATLSGAANSNYVFQASTNLANWISLTTNNSANGIISFTDTDAPNYNKRFYRAFSP